MKISCNRDLLLHAFQAVAAVAPPRSPKPILQNVRLDIIGPETPATLTATDLEVSIRHEVEGVESEAPGAILLPVGRFGSILRESSDSVFRIETDGQKTIVRGEHSTFSLASEDASEFPSAEVFDADSYFQCPAALLKTAIRRTIFATDNESSRYALGGVKFESEEGNLLAIGTDGRRLAKMQGPIESVGSPDAFGDATIVPSRSLQLIERTIADGAEIVRIAVRQNAVLVSSGPVTFSTRLLEGRFPRWRDVFPQRSESAQIELTAGPFFSAVRQAAIVTSDDSRGVDFTFGEGMLVLSGRAAEVGDSRVEMPIGYDGKPIEITLDPRFVIDFLKTLDSEESFTLDLVDGDSAAVARVDDGYAYVIMPLARDRK